ncbi:MAG: hypothetical protein ACYTG7_20490 [Planctomycetota bacterium]|jgi:hypothetical protein
MHSKFEKTKSFHSGLFGAICLVLLPMLIIGCATNYKLVMKPDVELVNEGGASPELAVKHYQKAMVIPPTGKPLGTFDQLIAQFETEFIKSGLTLISSAKSADMEIDAKDEDLAIAVQKVQESGAEVVIKIIQFEWTEEPELTRFFILEDQESESLSEVEEEEYLATDKRKYALNSAVLHFSGKIVDVATAQVLETFKIQTAANWNLEAPYLAKLRHEDKGWRLVGENFGYEEGLWIPGAKKKAEAKVIGFVAGKVRK